LNERSTQTMTPRLPIPRDSEAKLQHILLHSAQIIAERGFGVASIRDISRATGISLSGLYYYFESKQKLLYLIQKHAFTSILKELQLRLSSASDPEERLRLFVQNHLEYFLTHPAEMKVLSHEEDALEEPYKKEIAAIKRRYYSLAHEIFDNLAAREALTGGNPRVSVLSLYGMMNWVYKWHNPRVDPCAEELAETISDIFLRGVLQGGNGTRRSRTEESRRLERFEKEGAAD
jgi:TetR/AcrR family transcriptional regulator, cholesterol catabolism regulator